MLCVTLGRARVLAGLLKGKQNRNTEQTLSAKFLLLFFAKEPVFYGPILFCDRSECRIVVLIHKSFLWIASPSFIASRYPAFQETSKELAAAWQRLGNGFDEELKRQRRSRNPNSDRPDRDQYGNVVRIVERIDKKYTELSKRVKRPKVCGTENLRTAGEL